MSDKLDSLIAEAIVQGEGMKVYLIRTGGSYRQIQSGETGKDACIKAFKLDPPNYVSLLTRFKERWPGKSPWFYIDSAMLLRHAGHDVKVDP
jgi:hypothetical protein